MTATLTIDAVRAWRPEALADAAVGVGTAREAVAAEVSAAKSAVERLTSVWQGTAADAAAERMAKEAATGTALADALEHARSALVAGAADIGAARTALLSTVTSIQDDGFTVASDGAVTPRTLPPVMTAPGDPTGAAAARDARQRTLNAAAVDHSAQLGTALAVVAVADKLTADRLAKAEVPQGLEAAVQAYLQRLMDGQDALAALGSAGAGGVALAMVVKKGISTATKGNAYLQFLKASFAPITDYGTMVNNFAKSDEMLDLFSKGAKNGGILRFVVGSKAATAVGKLFLPLTVVTGGIDAITGGGYEGGRGWATRGFGAAGALGAGALIASGAGLIALGPVGLGIAGAAVIAYGAWSLGNLVWDNREAIGDFFQSVGGHIADGASAAWRATAGVATDAWNATAGVATDAWNATTSAVSDATKWAGDRLSDAGDAISDFGKGALNTLSFGFL
ncbi:hypothetical protein [Cellulomonas chengniuliangii]|uniref:Uncharacterized protein n=1 Tax=Cellulomonas chengniuliangii TaxID=2968084 RepID=A0ABY5KZH4_9CELL|nr:hypothetical protein [Cellulomonas chengniuliangii]MCC2309326.1 hypothetical protein [Cellulomonas chengniuliangii]MCC2316596.1 hypothetical protein [Cellulomonas chengniuliangii]UUI75105.1 hypothetical protein NP064_15230 [Cellulomonas chengniuliangii]